MGPTSYSIIATFLLLVSSSKCLSANLELDPVVRESIDNLISNTFIPSNQSPAATLAIVGLQGNGTPAFEHITAFGYKDYGKLVNATNQTLFFVGSISKSFTATVVVKALHEKFPNLGETVLDTPIRQLAPFYNFTLVDRYRSESGTFRDILSHRTCVLIEPLGLLVAAFNDTKEYVYRQRYAPSGCPFRGGFIYNNAHFALASDLIAEICGISFGQLLDNLFADLGMTGSTYVKLTDEHDEMMNRAKGYYVRDGEFSQYASELFKRVTPAIASGGIMSSSADMGKYMKFHLSLGKVDGVHIVPESVMKWLHKSSNYFSPTLKSSKGEIIDTNVGYSLGLNVGTYDGYLRLNHDGYLTPFNSKMSLFPGLKLGIFTSTSGPGVLPDETGHHLLHNQIFDIIQGNQRKSFQTRRPKNSPTTPKLTQPLPNLITKETTKLQSQIVGHYGNPLAGEMDIVLRDSEAKLYMSYGSWGKAWLVPQSNSNVTIEFSLEWDPAYAEVLQDYFIDAGSDVLDIVMVYDIADDFLKLVAGGIGSLDFFRGMGLDSLPPQPWAGDSCAPFHANFSLQNYILREQNK